MPGQTIEEMVDTLIYLMGKRLLIGPSIYYPTPGTPLFERCKKEGILPSHFSQWRSSALPIETKEFSWLDLLTLFRLARVINFVKAKMDEEELDEGITWKELLRDLKDKVEVELKDDQLAWINLILNLFREKAFFGLRKDSGGRVSALKEKSSKKVVDYFFDKALENPILKSRAISNKEECNYLLGR
jgi:hypothetical protein